MPITQTQTGEQIAGLGWLGDSNQEVVLHFATGMPGFPDVRRFRIEPLGPELEPFCRMRSLDMSDISFTIMPPGVVFQDYSVVVDEESVERLGLKDASDAVILAIVTVAVPPEPPKVNLLGPIVVNRHTLEAAQVVQHGSAYGVAVPLTPKEE